MKIKMTVQNKLFMGFGAVLVIVALVSINTFSKMSNVAEIEHRLIKLRLPTVMAGMHLTDGIHLSLAGLRAYMILGKNPKAAEKFKAERQHGWDQIDSAVAEMDEFSKNWTDPKNIEMLAQMKGFVEEFRTAQQEVEDISHTDANVPAFNMLLTEAAPRAGKVLGAVSAIIDEEATLSATPERKKLLKLLADSRGSFAIGLANIRAYLLSGDNKFADNFHAKWKVNETRFNQISSMTGLFNSTQSNAWKTYKNMRAEFAPLPPKMFALRSGKDWNLANYWLGSKAAPKAGAIMKILKEMRVSQDQLAIHDEEALESETTSMKTVMIIGALIALAVGVFISLFISRMITVPLNAVVSRAKTIASGDLTGAALASKGDDELTELTDAINEMSGSLQDIIQQVLGSTAQLGAAAEEMSAITMQTSHGIQEQQSQTDQLATAMNEMAATVQEVARHAVEAAAAASKANNESSNGRQVVNDAVNTIDALSEAIRRAAEAIQRVTTESDRSGSDVDGSGFMGKPSAGLAGGGRPIGLFGRELWIGWPHSSPSIGPVGPSGPVQGVRSNQTFTSFGKDEHAGVGRDGFWCGRTT